MIANIFPPAFSRFYLFLLFFFSFCTAYSHTCGGADSPDNASRDSIRFAFISDTHVGSHDAAEDLRRTVRDINGLDGIDFVIISGDITELGWDEELQLAKDILDGCNKPWYVVPGNHDTKWSESGCNSFRRIFGYDRFAFDHKGYKFVGCSSGPNMRMAPGLVPREDIVWLDSITGSMKGSGQPLVFINHYPLDEGLANWYLVINKLKRVNVQAALCGHGHRNRAMDFEGIPGVMGRSNLRATDPRGAYNIVTMKNDTMYFAERAPGGPTQAAWHKLALTEHSFDEAYVRPSYAINGKYPDVKVLWEKQDNSDVGAGIVASGDLCYYPNTSGEVIALSVETGKEIWRFKTTGKVYSTPAVEKGKLVVASTDSSVYCLNAQTGKLIWKLKTGKSVVASPVIDRNTVYIGASDGVFRAITLDEGKLLWKFDGLAAFVETRPLVYRGKVFFGDWGKRFYALDKKTGELAWQWESEKGSLMFSPAACFPVASRGNVFFVAPDRYLRAFDAKTGKESWASNKYRGRESLGISADGDLLFVKSMQDTIWAVPVRESRRSSAWYLDCGFGYEISPSPSVASGEIIYVPTDEGVLYAIDKDAREVIWARKLSNALINNVFPLESGAVLAATMDGKIVKLGFEAARD